MSEQYDSLSEKTKNIEIAIKYTGGDIDKAKSMVAGQYQDIIVIKGKFNVENIDQSGIFFSFINIIDEYIANITSVMSSGPVLFNKTRIFDDWKPLFNDLSEVIKSDTIVNSDNFSNFLLDSFISYDVFPLVQDGNLDELTRTVKEILIKSFNDKSVQCQIELEPTSSLAIVLAGITIDKPGTGEETRKDEGTGGEAVVDERISSIEKEASYVIPGKIIVSPVKGKYINDITIGEKISVILPGRDPVSQKILSLLNAVDKEGNVLPIKGRVKDKIPLEKSGYIIYAFVAKKVLVKIIEEENVKIQIDRPVEEEEEARSDSKFLYFILALIGLIIVSIFIIYMLLSN